MYTLSLSLIVKNEAHHLPRALEFASLFADEIVIVDTGSTDNTKEVARRFTDKIFDFKWCDDFSKARNFGLAQCTKDFIMVLDADEIILEGEALKIRRLMESPIDWDVLYVNLYWSHDPQGNPTDVFKKTAIFRNFIGITFHYPIHECLKWPPRELKYNLEGDIYIHHRNSPFHKDEEPTKDSASRNLAILKKTVQGEYKDSNRMWWCLANEYRHMNQPEKAIECYREALKKQDEKNSSVLSEQNFQLATQYIKAKDLEAALETLGQAIQLDPCWREPYFEAGKIYFEQGRYQEALQMFLIVQTIKRPTTKTIYSEDLYSGYLSDDYLSLTYGRLEEWEKALTHARKALEYLPDDNRLKGHEQFYRERLFKSGKVD